MKTPLLLAPLILTLLLSYSTTAALPINTHTNSEKTVRITGPYTTEKTQAGIALSDTKITGVAHIQNIDSVTLNSGTVFDKSAKTMIEAKTIHIQSGVTFETGSNVRLKGQH